MLRIYCRCEKNCMGWKTIRTLSRSLCSCCLNHNINLLLLHYAVLSSSIVFCPGDYILSSWATPRAVHATFIISPNSTSCFIFDQLNLHSHLTGRYDIVNQELLIYIETLHENLTVLTEQQEEQQEKYRYGSSFFSHMRQIVCHSAASVWCVYFATFPCIWLLSQLNLLKLRNLLAASACTGRFGCSQAQCSI